LENINTSRIAAECRSSWSGENEIMPKIKVPRRHSRIPGCQARLRGLTRQVRPIRRTSHAARKITRNGNWAYIPQARTILFLHFSILVRKCATGLAAPPAPAIPPRPRLFHPARQRTPTPSLIQPAACATSHPSPFKLYFQRFLNEDRAAPPDAESRFRAGTSAIDTEMDGGRFGRE